MSQWDVGISRFKIGLLTCLPNSTTLTYFARESDLVYLQWHQV